MTIYNKVMEIFNTVSDHKKQEELLEEKLEDGECLLHNLYWNGDLSEEEFNQILIENNIGLTPKTGNVSKVYVKRFVHPIKVKRSCFGCYGGKVYEYRISSHKERKLLDNLRLNLFMLLEDLYECTKDLSLFTLKTKRQLGEFRGLCYKLSKWDEKYYHNTWYYYDSSSFPSPDDLHLCDKCKSYYIRIQLLEKINLYQVFDFRKWGISYKDYLYTDHWRDVVRPKALKRAKNKCQLCGSRKSPNVHHNSYKHIFKEHEHMEDVLVLCSHCHENFHENSMINESISVTEQYSEKLYENSMINESRSAIAERFNEREFGANKPISWYSLWIESFEGWNKRWEKELGANNPK